MKISAAVWVRPCSSQRGKRTSPMLFSLSVLTTMVTSFGRVTMQWDLCCICLEFKEEMLKLLAKVWYLGFFPITVSHSCLKCVILGYWKCRCQTWIACHEGLMVQTITGKYGNTVIGWVSGWGMEELKGEGGGSRGRLRLAKWFWSMSRCNHCLSMATRNFLLTRYRYKAVSPDKYNEQSTTKTLFSPQFKCLPLKWQHLYWYKFRVIDKIHDFSGLKAASLVTSSFWKYYQGQCNPVSILCLRHNNKPHEDHTCIHLLSGFTFKWVLANFRIFCDFFSGRLEIANFCVKFSWPFQDYLQPVFYPVKSL